MVMVECNLQATYDMAEDCVELWVHTCVCVIYIFKVFSSFNIKLEHHVDIFSFKENRILYWQVLACLLFP